MALGPLVGSISGFTGMAIAKKLNIQKSYKQWMVVGIDFYVMVQTVFCIVFPSRPFYIVFFLLFPFGPLAAFYIFPLILGAWTADTAVDYDSSETNDD
jgi:hypothetical protein